MTCWKATRLNGTDFHTGTVDYATALASGRTVTTSRGPGDLTFLAQAGTTCNHPHRGVWACHWPCRLFEVEPTDDLARDRPATSAQVGATAVRVLAWMPMCSGAAGRESRHSSNGAPR